MPWVRQHHRIVTTTPNVFAREAELRDAAARAGLRLHIDSRLKAAGGEFVRLCDRSGVVIASHRTTGAALAWIAGRPT